MRVLNPRVDQWAEHLEWDGPILVGKTPVGRALVAGLRLNRALILGIREEETVLGRHPPEFESD